MKKALRRLSICVAVVIIAALLSLPAFAANDYSNEDIAANAANAEISGNSETTENSESQASNASSESGVLSAKAIAAAIAISLAAAGGAVGMGIAIAKSADGISRQPEASGNIRTSFDARTRIYRDRHNLCSYSSDIDNIRALIEEALR